MKRLVAALLLLCLLTLAGCKMFTPSPKEFSKAGMTITLTDEFVESENISYTAYYASPKIAVFALKEEFTYFENPDEISLDEYTEMVIANNGMDTEVKHHGDTPYFEFEKTINGKEIHYLAMTYRGADAFWLIQFSSEVKDYSSLSDDILSYAESVKV